MLTTIRTRRDACPGVLSPHDAADGALARVRLPGGVVTAAQLRAVADVADRCGDGAAHLTSRGNLQLRGLDRADRAVQRLLADAGLLPSPSHERVRNVLASPASGIDGGLADVRGLAAALDHEICARPGLASLPGRFLFALDDGRDDVAAEDPDVCWRASGPESGELLVAGGPTGLTCGPADAAVRMADAAAAFLSVRDGAADGTAWRAAEVPDAAARIGEHLRRTGAGRAGGGLPPGGRAEPGTGSGGRPGDRPAATTVGPIGSAGAVGAAPVLGELTAPVLRLLADLAPSAVVTPWRTVLLPAPHEPTTAADRLRDAGLVVHPAHPALQVSACAGRPGCARSLADVRRHARAVIRNGTVSADEPAMHLSGCARRCGAPRAAHVDAVATGPGEYIVDGVGVPAADLTAHPPEPDGRTR